jgi:hypothetical protein
MEQMMVCLLAEIRIGRKERKAEIKAMQEKTDATLKDTETNQTKEDANLREVKEKIRTNRERTDTNQAKMNANQVWLEAEMNAIREKMETNIDANNEKFEVLQGTCLLDGDPPSQDIVHSRINVSEDGHISREGEPTVHSIQSK